MSKNTQFLAKKINALLRRVVVGFFATVLIVSHATLNHAQDLTTDLLPTHNVTASTETTDTNPADDQEAPPIKTLDIGITNNQTIHLTETATETKILSNQSEKLISSTEKNTPTIDKDDASHQSAETREEPVKKLSDFTHATSPDLTQITTMDLDTISEESRESLRTAVIRRNVSHAELADIVTDLDDGVRQNSLINITIDNKAQQIIEPNFVFQVLQTEASQESLQEKIYDWWYGLRSSFVHQHVWQAQQATTARGEGVLVAVIDTGIAINHPDLSASIWSNPQEVPGNGVDDDLNGYIDDTHGWNFFAQNNDITDTLDHGTRVAGLITATGTSNYANGVAPMAKIMALKVCSDSGICPADRIITAIQYAVAQKAKIISIALGSEYYSQILKLAIDAAVDDGVLIISSSGNTARDQIYYPAGYKKVIAVGSTNHDGTIASFSNTGEGLDFVAPGVDITSTNNSGGYTKTQGTSLSAGIVTGLFALFESAFPHVAPQAILAGVEHTTQNSLGTGYNVQTGYGLIDPVNFLKLTDEQLNAFGAATPHETNSAINDSAPLASENPSLTPQSALTVDIVDASNMVIQSPNVTMSAVDFEYAVMNSLGVLGTANAKIRLSNQTATTAWTVSIAATNSPSALWEDQNAHTFDYNDTPDNGRLTVNPAPGVIVRGDGGSVSGTLLGSEISFAEGVVNSITLFSSTTAATMKEYDLTGVSLLQTVPARQPTGIYSIEMTLTAI